MQENNSNAPIHNQEIQQEVRHTPLPVRLYMNHIRPRLDRLFSKNKGNEKLLNSSETSTTESSQQTIVNEPHINTSEFDENTTEILQDLSHLNENTITTEYAELPSRTLNVARDLKDRVEKNNIEFLLAQGQPALLSTNENMTGRLQEFHEIRDGENAPNGHMIVVGISGGLANIELFPEEPKSLIMTDIDPRVILMGNTMIQAMTLYETPQEFFDNFFSKVRMRSMLSQNIRNNTKLTEHFGADALNISEEIANKYSNESNWSHFRNQLSSAMAVASGNKQDQYTYETEPLNVLGVLAKHYSTFRQLSIEGNMAMVHGNLTDQKFLNELSALPDFNESSNVIDLSNVVDHVTGRGIQPTAGLPLMNNVGVLAEKSPSSYFVDALGTRNYNKKIQKGFKPYEKQDVQDTAKYGQGMYFSAV